MRLRARVDGFSEGWVERHIEDLRARLRRGEFGSGAQVGFGRRRFVDAQGFQARSDGTPEFLSLIQDSDEP
jgi:hypothetical protein